MKQENVRLKDGTIVVGDAFDNSDFIKLQEIFKQWVAINKQLKELGGRNLNVPDVFSEALFCLAYDAVRTNSPFSAYLSIVTVEEAESTVTPSSSVSTERIAFSSVIAG